LLISVSVSQLNDTLTVSVDVSNIDGEGWSGWWLNTEDATTISVDYQYELTATTINMPNAVWQFRCSGTSTVYPEVMISYTLNYVVEPPAPGYRFFAFYGEPDGSDYASFHEIELTLETPLNGLSEIKYGVNDTEITFHESKAWDYSGGADYSTIMNGVKSWSDPNRLRYVNVATTNAIFWYMDMGTGVAADVNGGKFWTHVQTVIGFTLGKLYGTNTDPATFADASLVSNYELVCDLTTITSG
jgi:hypothetical protein